MKKLKSSVALHRLMEAEGNLARENARKIEQDIESLPDGDPVRKEANRQKAMLGGDLSGLPPGHPLLVMLEEARLRYEAAQEQKSDEGEKAAEETIRKAKKLDARKRSDDRAARDAAEDKAKKKRVASKDLKSAMEHTLVTVRTMKDSVANAAEAFQGDAYAMARMQRLFRMAVAVEKWVIDGMVDVGRIG